MSPESRCTHCGAALVADAPQGLCPACLLQRGLDAETGSHDGGSQPSAGDYVAPTPAELAPHFPDLEILELLGQGGMGVVYKARQKKLNRLIALKILAGKVGPDPAFADRFTREARALAMLNHPHIVTVYDFGQTGGLYYFLMEFVDGVNLRQLLDNGKLAPTAALAIVPQICEALQYAHDKGIVHRDIKPANILLDTSGRVKIADFGVAKLMGQKSEEGPLTGEGHVMGTPHYMAPEQVEHPLEVDHRADIFSLGVVFYQMLTGELPLGRFGPPSRKVEIDVRLDEVVLRALEKEPDRRYQQASEVKTRVEKIVSTPGALPASLTANQKAWQSPTMGWGHFVGYLFGITFTSPLAYKLANLSALGFLAFLAFFKYVPLPGSHWFSGFAGLSGLFGLIGVAFMIEMVTRYKASTAAGNAPTASSDDDAQRQTRQVIQRPSISLWALVATGAAGLLIVLLGTWVIVRDKDGKEVARIMVPDGGTAQVKTGPAKEKRGAMPTRQRSDYGTKKSPGSRDTTASAEQPTPDNGIPTKLHPLATSALLDERPQLRFLAWQDEWTTNQPRGAFHADGTEVTDPSELRLLRIIGATLCDASGTAEGKGNPRFLHLWFSHPLIDEQSMNQVTLLDDEGQPVPLGAGGMFASGAREVDDSGSHLGWLTDTLCPDDGANVPATLTMRLRYTLGPWKQQRQFAPDERGIIALGDGSQFNAIGQDLEGKAFFSIAVDMKQDSARQFGVVAVTKDGRELQPSRFNRGGGNGEAVQVQRFIFDVSLADIAHFLLSTRHVMTAEFPNVTLQPQPLPAE